MRAVFEVIIGGQNITTTLSPYLIALSVSDKAGSSSDTASLTLDDTGGVLVMPERGASVSILLGWAGQGIGQVFEGTVDEVRATGGRSGRTLSISAKGMDTGGKAKQAQRRHFDDKSIKDALTEAGREASFTVTVDEEIGKAVRPYIALDDESFAEFGERLAKEVGGTFKISGKNAILAKRNGGVNAKGEPLATVSAAWGLNLHDYDITPVMGRTVEKHTTSRWFDATEMKWKTERVSTQTEGATTTRSSRFTEPDQSRAKEQAGSDAAESDRNSGEGTVRIEGNIGAQPEGLCAVSGCRPGIDGLYRIDGVEHEYSRSGFITRLELKQPKDGAGKDSR